jgi:polyribonucleotide nucleotidyltransferase
LSKGNLPKAERKETYKGIYDDLIALLSKEENLPEGEEVASDVKKLVKKYLGDMQ